MKEYVSGGRTAYSFKAYRCLSKYRYTFTTPYSPAHLSLVTSDLRRGLALRESIASPCEALCVRVARRSALEVLAVFDRARGPARRDDRAQGPARQRRGSGRGAAAAARGARRDRHMCAAAAFVGIDVVLDRNLMGNGRSSSSSTRSTRPRRLRLAELVERAARHDLRGARPLRRRAAAHRSSSSTTQILAATIEPHQTISGEGLVHFAVALPAMLAAQGHNM